MKIAAIIFASLIVSLPSLLGATEPEFSATQKIAADSVLEAIAHSEYIELVEISPSNFDKNGHKIDPATSGTIDGYKIIGKAKVGKKDEGDILGKALRQSIMEAGWGDIALCFMPHHALRIKDGPKITVIVVCFHCAQGYATSGSDVKSFVLSDSAENAWNRIFKSYGLLKHYKEG